MNQLSHEQAARREKTLLASLLLSAWGPVVTVIAVILSESTTQLADFIRRSVELLALFVSWWVFRYLQRNKGKYSPAVKARMEKLAGSGVAAALGCSGLVMLFLAFTPFSANDPGGNVYPGMIVAFLGLVVNSWFWQRYAWMTREQYNPITDAQRRLYRAKALVDTCVIFALSAVAFFPGYPATRYIDTLGSVILALYLLWSSFRTLRPPQDNC